jgi:anti-anti-sigma regulatory factor
MRAMEALYAGSPAPGRTGSFPVKRLGDRLAVISAGTRLDELRARAFARTALCAVNHGIRELVLDLSAVRHHAWPAVYALCDLEAHLAEACCEAVAVAAEDHLVRDLQTVGLEQSWSLRASLPDALTELLERPVLTA